MKKIKKLLSVALCGLMAVSVVGCGGSSDDGGNTGTNGGTSSGDKTVINCLVYSAGVSDQYLRDLIKVYEEAHKDVSYETGKVGVQFKISNSDSTEITSTSSDHFFSAHGRMGAERGSTLGQGGYTMDLTEIVNSPNPYNEDGATIRSRIDDLYYERELCGVDGKCYALPSYSLTSGLTLDAYQFKSKGFYLAHPDTWGTDNAVWYYSEKYKMGCWFIVGSGNADFADGVVLSVGNDGVADTLDDGMPTSLEEFIVMCDYMKSKNVTPFLSYRDGKTDEILDSFWSSLAGYEQYQARYTFGKHTQANGYEEGEGGIWADVVTGVNTSKTLWGTSYIYEPIVERKFITEKTGYWADQTAARYYAVAMLKMAVEEGWFLEVDTNLSHLEGEEKFVLNGLNSNEEIGMLVEGNYWYNESKKAGSVEKFNEATGGDRSLDLMWMRLPTLVTGSVTGIGTASGLLTSTDGTGSVTAKSSTDWDLPIVRIDGTANQHTDNNTYGAPIFLNNRYSNQPKIKALLLDFMQFLYSDDSLSYYTGSEGVFRAGMRYDINDSDMEKLSDIQQQTIQSQLEAERTISPARHLELYNDLTRTARNNSGGSVTESITGFFRSSRKGEYNIYRIFVNSSSATMKASFESVFGK